MRDVPILAVQLPPQSVRDTAGPAARILSGAGPALAGDRGAAADARHDVPPMVVTISLGSLAVPGDEHAFLADWLKPEVARYARYGATVRLVLTYDNARLARLRARGELRRSQPVKLIWRVQPDDRTSSHLEVSVDASMTVGRKSGRCRRQRRIFRGLEVPSPRARHGLAAGRAGGGCVLGLRSGWYGAVARRTGLDSRPSGVADLPPGGWRIVLRTTEAQPVRLTARVWRDDTPFGCRTLGRQSWLDHLQSWDWDPDLCGHLALRSAADAMHLAARSRAKGPPLPVPGRFIRRAFFYRGRASCDRGTRPAGPGVLFA